MSILRRKQDNKEVIMLDKQNITLNHLPDIDQMVLDYVNAASTDYAIMLKGAWGVGKTFYWNHVLSKIIEDIDSPVKIKDNVVKYKALHVSLFGIDSLNSLIMRITRAKYINSDKKWVNSATSIAATGVKKLAKKYDIDNEDFESLIKILKDVDQKRFVFCFDDLERIGEDSLLFDVLGYINSMVENEGVKVVILCNEDELLKKHSSNKYSSYKEKLIRFTLQMSTDVEKVLLSLVEKSETNFKEFISKNKFSIVDFYKKGECDNIRTLKFNIEVFQQLYAIIIGNNLNEYEDQVKIHYLMLSMLYSIEYKNGAKEEDLQELLDLTSDSTYEIDFDIKTFNKLAGVEHSAEKELSYIERVKNMYFSISPSKIGSSAAFLDYMKTGRLDKDKINGDIKHTLEALKDKEITEEQQLLRALNNVWILDDKELDEIITGLLNKAQSGDLSLGLYPSVFARINALISNGFIKGPDTEELLKKFNRGIKRAKPRTVYNEKFEQGYHLMSLNMDDETKQIADSVLQIYKNLGKDEAINQFQKSIALLWNQSIDMKEYTTSHYPLLASYKPKALLDDFINTSNAGRHRFYTFIQARIEYCSIAVPEETDFLKSFKNLCKAHVEKNEKPSILSKYLSSLIQILTQYNY